MMFKKYILPLLLLGAATTAMAQPVSSFASMAGREQFVKNTVNNIIIKGLAKPLKDTLAEQDWESTFWAMELMQYRHPWIQHKIDTAFLKISKRSIGFQRALVELCYTNYPVQYQKPIAALLQKTADAKIAAMCCEYLRRNMPLPAWRKLIAQLQKKKYWDINNPILNQLQWRMLPAMPVLDGNMFDILFNPNFLPRQVVVFSLQRRNRNFPGLAIVRDTTGAFIKDSTGQIFVVQQLARSITNLPGYLTNGNTPQGFFRMQGFAVSTSRFIGPTENIQLVMPYEVPPNRFMPERGVTDSVWTDSLYNSLLPVECAAFPPFWESYYASKAGRTEIIAHGTTIDPNYYRGATYFPHTPTLGCLCTKELWGVDGRRTVSNQQLLNEAVKQAGGATGYVVVLEIDDKNAPVQLTELLRYIK
jgi:hypothetical protein